MVGVKIVANAYRKDDRWTFRLPAGELGERSWKLTDSGNWYDFTLTAAGLRATIRGAHGERQKPDQR